MKDTEKTIKLNRQELRGTRYRKFKINIQIFPIFSLTGSAWLHASHKSKTTEELEYSDEPDLAGCIHKEILEISPQLEIFAKLHLSDPAGQPMHALSNGLYYIEEGKDETAIQHFRVTPADYKILKEATANLNDLQTSRDHKIMNLSSYLISSGITRRWRDEADKARELFENLKTLEL